MNKFLAPRSRPLLIAHRGANRKAPENTMAAFSRAHQDGADAIELDVQLSSDGHVVVIHDTTVNRTTNGRGKVSKLTLNQLQQLDAGVHEGIPTLEEVLDEFSDKLGILIEMKNYTSWRDGLEVKVAELVRAKGVQDSVMFGSFLPWSLRKVRKIIPEATTCVFYFPYMGWISLVWRRWIAVMGPGEAGISKAKVRQMHRHGKLVNVWVVDTAEEAREMQKEGVNMITTDDVELISTSF